MFEPTTLPTAIDGLPSNAEKILTISSGNDVPNATTVKPITKDEIPNPHQLRLWLSLNGKMMQDSNTDDLIFNIPQLISYSSQFMTLLPGDVISTGTPAGVGLGFSPNIYLKPGDIVELGIDGLGSSKQTAIAYQK